MDSLVVMIAGMLVPAWLLGHLFLTFYPAPDGGIVAAGQTDTATVSASQLDDRQLDDDPSRPADPPALDHSNSNQPEADSANEFKVELDSMTEKFQSLTATTANLESEVASLQQTNASLAEENATLKAQAAQAPAMSVDGANASDSSAAMNELQSKYESASQRLETAKQELVDTTTRLETTENEKRTLQQDLTNATSKLEQANANLAAAVTKNEANMEIKPESGSSASPFATLEPEEDSPQLELAAETNAKVTELEQKLRELTLNLANTNKVMATQKEELQSAQTKLQSAQTNLQSTQTELQTAQSELQNLMAQNGELKTALNVARDKVAQNELPKEVFRDFVSSKGSVSKMAFIRWEGDNIIVRSFATKKLHRLTLDRFSEADKQYLLQKK